ncbi:MAG: hypothetical protein LBS81_06295 [Endomicrobium sp.]|jgi:hypothetical protein|nr:hypothetical protein [Endomicrobium sp.]
MESSAFVVIEYKRDKNPSVVDQGFTYLNFMLNNKSDFILEYKEAVNFKDIAIELWEIQRYEGNIFSITQIDKSQAAESIKPIMEGKTEYKEISAEIKVYTEKDHLNNKPEETIELYKI